MQKLMEQALQSQTEQLRQRATVRSGETTEVVLVQPRLDAAASGCRWNGAVTMGGQPVVRALLTVEALGGEGGPRLGYADEQGRFHFDGLRAGEHVVTVREGWVGGGVHHRRRVMIPEQSTLRQDLELPSGQLAGQVVERGSGKPVRGAFVSLVRPDGEAVVADAHDSVVITDGEGRFDFRGLGAESYALETMDLGAGPANGQARLGPIRLAAGERRLDLRLEVQSGAALELTVLDPSGVPAPDAQVWLLDASGAPLGLAHPASPDQDGVVRLAGLASGTYLAFARSPRAAPGFSQRVTVPARDPAPALVPLRTGPGVELVVRPTTDLPLVGARLRVTDAEGRSILLPPELLFARQAEAGVYAIGHLPPGRITVAAEHRSFGRRQANVVVPGGTQARLELKF
jgi:hypothetical protein